MCCSYSICPNQVGEIQIEDERDCYRDHSVSLRIEEHENFLELGDLVLGVAHLVFEAGLGKIWNNVNKSIIQLKEIAIEMGLTYNTHHNCEL